RGYVQIYLERDVRAVTAVRDLATFRRFLALLASRCEQILNKTDLSAPLGLSVPTLTQWLGVLEVTGQIILVPPFFENAVSNRPSPAPPRSLVCPAQWLRHRPGTTYAAPRARDPSWLDREPSRLAPSGVALPSRPPHRCRDARRPRRPGVSGVEPRAAPRVLHRSSPLRAAR